MRSQVLESSSWIFYRARYDCCSDNSCGGTHIPLLLAQLGDLTELDTQDLDTRLEIKCWTPAEACYDGDWIKWKERGKQLVSTVPVAEVALTKVHFTTAKEKKGGKRMVALAIRTQLRDHSQSQYGKFGQKPAPAKGKGKERRTRGRGRERKRRRRRRRGGRRRNRTGSQTTRTNQVPPDLSRRVRR